MFESLQESSATGVKKFGRPHTTKLISEQGVKKGFPGLTKQAGDITGLKTKLEKATGKKIGDLKIPKRKKIMPGIEIKGRSKIANYRHGGRTKKFGGGRTNLLEQLGRVEAEPSNPNRRAEISRVHGELNRGYAKGGRAEGGRIGLRKGKGVIPKRSQPPHKETTIPSRLDSQRKKYKIEKRKHASGT